MKFKTKYKLSYQFKFFFHFACNVDAFFANRFDGIQLPFVEADRRENAWITKICIRIWA